jgi:hypothetical protein
LTFFPFPPDSSRHCFAKTEAIFSPPKGGARTPSERESPAKLKPSWLALWLPFPHALTAASARPRYLAFFRPVSKIPPHLMRPPVRLQKLETLMAPMGRRVKSAGRIYLAGGATALLHG